MTLRRGTSLLDLLPQTTELAGMLPDKIVDRIGILTVVVAKKAFRREFKGMGRTIQGTAKPAAILR